MNNRLPTLKEVDGIENIRLDQLNLLPGSIKRRNLGELVTMTSDEVATVTIGNGQQAVLTSTLSEDQGDKFVNTGILGAEFYVAFFEGTPTPANEIGRGANVDESDWQIIGPRYDWLSFSVDEYPKHKSIATVYIRNISAGSVSLTVVTRWKVWSQNATTA